jgi:hypothetical protein
VSLAAGGEVQRQHPVLPEEAGLQEGMVQIEEMDALAVDNHAYFCFSVPERLEVLLVGDEASSREIRPALAPKSGDKQLINLTRSGRDSWDVQPISRFDVIIFSDPPNFSQAQSSRLAHFVEKGGGLLILPGSGTDVAAVNRDLLAKLGALRWGEKIGQPGRPESFLSWRQPNLEAPILKGILRPGSQPSAPRFYQALRLVNAGGESAIHLSNGMPFFSESRLGQGRVILCASSPQPVWSDWAQRGIFAPLLHRFVLRLAGGSSERCQVLTAGDNLEVASGATAGAPARLVFPDGQEVKLPPQVMGQKAAYVQPSLPQAGIYQLEVGTTRYIAAVNVPPEESSLQTVDLREAYSDWHEEGARICTPDQLAEMVRQSRYGQELWKAALIAGLGLLLLESALGRSSGKRGSEDEGETA